MPLIYNNYDLKIRFKTALLINIPTHITYLIKSDKKSPNKRCEYYS